MSDPVLDKMADELHEALVQRGLDPQHPPTEMNPPTERFFEEYRKRGGSVYTEPDAAMQQLIALVKSR